MKYAKLKLQGQEFVLVQTDEEADISNDARAEAILDSARRHFENQGVLRDNVGLVYPNVGGYKYPKDFCPWLSKLPPLEAQHWQELDFNLLP